MLDLDFFASVRDFVETGGSVLRVIAGLTFVMWCLILERLWYFGWIQGKESARVLRAWQSRRDHRSWTAHQIRRMMISEYSLGLQRGLIMIKALVALCPMLGLLGTVTGMIEVFDVMAVSGSGAARGMAAGVSKATLPTMAGMVAALSGLMISIQLERFADQRTKHIADQMEVIHT